METLLSFLTGHRRRIILDATCHWWSARGQAGSSSNAKIIPMKGSARVRRVTNIPQRIVRISMVTETRRAWLATIAMILLFSGQVEAQTGVITGRVMQSETGTGLADVTVRAETVNGVIAATTQTASGGEYRLAGLAAGSYTVIASSLGYREARVASVAVASGQTVTLPIRLDATAIALEEITVTSGGPKNILRSEGSEAVVSREKIEARLALQPTEHLKGIIGIDYAQTGLFTSTVVARGFSNVFSTSLLAITDHRYTNVPSLRVNTAFLMPTVNEDIERIEVLLGPGSALYGPNAANGVMHVITQSPFAYPGTTISVGGGERDVLSTALRHAGVIGERLGYKVTGQWMRGREWEFVDQEEIDARAADPSIPSRDFDLERWSGELRADYRVSDSTAVIFNAGRVAAENAIEMTPFGAAQARGWEYTYFQGRLRAKRLFLQGFLNTSDAGDTFLLRTGEPIVDKSRLMAGQIRHSTPLGDRQTFIYGVDVQRTDPRTGGTIHGRFEDDDGSDEIGGYIHSETLLSPQLDLILAARYDYHSRVEDNVLSPRAAVVFHPVPNHNFRATYNRAFGTPLNSQLFLDLEAGSLGALPFEIRAIGGSPGYNYRRDCAGDLCIRSPFPAAGESAPSPSELRDLDATQFWGAATNILFQSSGGTVDIRAIPAPGSAQVSTVLRLLNPNPAGAFFQTVDKASLRDIAPLAPSISNTFEVGYKGFLANRVMVGIDVWHQRRSNFVSAALVETPNVFLEQSTLQAYLANFMSPQQAGQIAAAMAGIDGNPSVTGIPLGTAAFDHPFTNDPNVYVTYRNYGDVELWGSDLGIEAALPARLTLTGAYSWLNDDTFRTVDFSGQEADVLLNAPANKGSVGVRWNQQQDGGGLTLNSLLRFVDGFPMNSGVYVGDVESYRILDLGLMWRPARVPGASLNVQAQNIFDEEQQQFVGAPHVGRLLTARLTYRFGARRAP